MLKIAKKDIKQSFDEIRYMIKYNKISSRCIYCAGDLRPIVKRQFKGSFELGLECKICGQTYEVKNVK